MPILLLALKQQVYLAQPMELLVYDLLVLVYTQVLAY
jgi:hypothetical protein